MRTAIDTNVFSALWSSEPSAERATVKLGEAKREGALIISPVVFAELLAYPRATEVFVRGFLGATGVSVDYNQEERVWIEMGRRFASYSDRRKKAIGEGPRRLLSDFLIGAHALVQAERLLTLDPKVYRQDFPELRLMYGFLVANASEDHEKCSQPWLSKGSSPCGVSSLIAGCPWRGRAMRPIFVSATPAILRGWRMAAGAVKSSS